MCMWAGISTEGSRFEVLVCTSMKHALPDDASELLIRQGFVAYTQDICRHQTRRDLCHLQYIARFCRTCIATASVLHAPCKP